MELRELPEQPAYKVQLEQQVTPAHRVQQAYKVSLAYKVLLVLKAPQVLKELQDKPDFRVLSVFKAAPAQQAHKVLKARLESRV
jgi:hypothetical protein